jgi:hypothetical protein
LFNLTNLPSQVVMWLTYIAWLVRSSFSAQLA